MFKIISTGLNSRPYAQGCVESIRAQTRQDWEAAIVDDASDDGTDTFLLRLCDDDDRFHLTLNRRRVGAMRNQWDGLSWLGVDDDDIVVWLDTDDRFAHPGVLDRVAEAYENGALVTYGSYEPHPPDHESAATCPPAKPYPPEVIEARSFRAWARSGKGVPVNHLRTVHGSIWNQLDDSDFRDADGNFYRTAADTAVMLPALELAAPHIDCIEDVLVTYTCDSPLADWRIHAKQVNADHAHQLARTPRR